MMGFTSNAAHDRAQLRRNRSFSRGRSPPTGEISFNPTSMSRRSPSSSIPSPFAVDRHKTLPPLLITISSGKPRGSTQDDDRSASPKLYESSFPSPAKRNSPPPFSNLILTTYSPTRPSPLTNPTQSKRADAKLDNKQDDKWSSDSHTTSHLTNQKSVSLRSYRTDVQELTLPEATGSRSHSAPGTQLSMPTPTLTFKPNLGIDHGMPLKSHGTDTSPAFSNQLRDATPTVSISKASIHTRLSSHPRPLPNTSLISDTVKPSRRGVGDPPLEITASWSSPHSTPTSSSASPSLATMMHPGQTSSRLLRKPSLSKCDLASAPTSDNERKTKTHRPRTRSDVFAKMRRKSSGNLIEVIKPPAPTTSLTPGEILVYNRKDLRLDTSFGNSRKTSLESTGKLIALGSPDDDMKSSRSAGWLSPEDADDVGKKIRGLSRKFSERWGGKGANRTRKADSGRHEVAEQTQESRRLTPVKRSASFHRETKIHTPPTSGLDSDTTPPSQSGWSQSTDEGEGRVWEEDVGDWALSHAHNKEVSDPSTPSRLWKLVKRFSSGNLKEMRREAPPPVPPLPNDVTLAQWKSKATAGPDADDIPFPQTVVPESPGGIMRYITSSPSVSVARAMKAPNHGRTASVSPRAGSGSSIPAGPPIPDVSAYSTKVTGATRGATGRSSSPSPEKIGIFSRSRSSSDSSYGETVPPMPHVHVTPAYEQDDLTNVKSDESIAATRLSPSGSSRDANTPGTPVSSSSSSSAFSVVSATIPKFDVHNPSNNFAPYKGSKQLNHPTSTTTHFPDTEPLTPRAKPTKLAQPPRRPVRSPHRPSSISIPSSPSLQQQSPPDKILTRDILGSATVDIGMDTNRRRPLDTQTPKAHPRSISDGAVMSNPAKSPDVARSQLMFREMTTKRRSLTEQEKNAKWEDLLQRSEMAGGTLHIGSQTAGGLSLWSDRSSVAPSETLNAF